MLRKILTDLAALLEGSPGRWNGEASLQNHLETVLAPLGFEREVTAGHDRFDFYRPADRIVVEVKIAGSPAQVLRQLLRYAGRPDVDGLVLATMRGTLVRTLPPAMLGKPVAAARLWIWAFRG